MLVLTDGAAEAVRELVAGAPEIPEETGGLRLQARMGRDGRSELLVALNERPGEADAVVGLPGARVFLAPGLLEELRGWQLDVRRSGGRVRFWLERQPSNGGADSPAGARPELSPCRD